MRSIGLLWREKNFLNERGLLLIMSNYDLGINYIIVIFVDSLFLLVIYFIGFVLESC